MTSLRPSPAHWRKALAALALTLPIAAHSQTEPLIVEAESGTVGADFTTGTLDGATYVAINSTDTTTPPIESRRVAYSVTFPDAGNYELYARFRVGPAGGNDDSWFISNGFAATTFANVNQVDGGGYTAPTDTVRNGGPATTQVFKWFKVSGFQGPALWTVPAGSLAQTFTFGGREDGLFMDKFAFGRAGSYYTVNNLDTGSAATGTPPPPDPPAYTPSGPPLATGHAKFLGSAHSPPQNRNFTAYWNQVTPENGGKWGSVEGTRDVMNWTEADAAYNLARTNGFLFKWHVLVWGNQQPGWMNALPPAEQLEEIHEWLAAIAERYPDLAHIEVVNEPLHDPPCTNDQGGGFYCNALGGTGATGWDWIIKSFELARQYFPNAKLMLNDYSITNDGNATTRYLEIIQLLKERGLIDLIGIQGHAFSTTGPMSTHTENIARLAQTGLPIYVTELDIDGNDDPVQLASYQRIFPAFWENPAIKGITLWGFNRGHWRTAQGAWLAYDNGAERPALQWLVRYMRNALPVVTAGQNFSIAENTADGTVVGTVSATDTDAGTTLSGWQIDGGSGAAAFAIDGASGAITVADSAALDFETVTSYTLNVSVYDGYRRSDSSTVTVDVTNANDNTPVIAAAQTFALDGGVRNMLGNIAATDADDSNQAGFTTLQNWQIVGGTGASLFAVNASTGTLIAARPTAIDFRKTSYTVQTRVSDGTHVSEPQTIAINIPNRIGLCLLVVDVEVPKRLAPTLLRLGASLGSCRQ